MTPILLFDGECNVCRRIAHWIESSARRQSGPPAIIVQAIGQDPAALALLNPDLNIWEAYAAPHVLMPDGSMKRAGYAVAEVFRLLPNTKWFAWIFEMKIFGVQPFQTLLNIAYIILADIRPILGCESCGGPPPWARPLMWIVTRVKSVLGGTTKTKTVHHFTSLPRSPKPSSLRQP